MRRNILPSLKKQNKKQSVKAHASFFLIIKKQGVTGLNCRQRFRRPMCYHYTNASLWLELFYFKEFNSSCTYDIFTLWILICKDYTYLISVLFCNYFLDRCKTFIMLSDVVKDIIIASIDFIGSSIRLLYKISGDQVSQQLKILNESIKYVFARKKWCRY